MNKHIEDFRKAVTEGTPVEAVARIYGLSKGPGESDAELASRLEMLLDTRDDFIVRAALEPSDFMRHPDESQSEFKKRVMKARGIKDVD